MKKVYVVIKSLSFLLVLAILLSQTTNLYGQSETIDFAVPYNVMNLSEIDGVRFYMGTRPDEIGTLVGDIKREDLVIKNETPITLNEKFDSAPGSEYEVKVGTWIFEDTKPCDPDNDPNVKIGDDDGNTDFAVEFLVDAGVRNDLFIRFYPLNGNPGNFKVKVKQDDQNYYLMNAKSGEIATWEKIAQNSDEIILDNLDTSTEKIGDWPASNRAGYYGADSVYSNKPNEEFKFNSNVTGKKEVYIWYTENMNRCTNAKVKILSGNILQKMIEVDQTKNGGMWNKIGEFDFQGKATVSIISSETSECVTVADAVRFLTPGAGEKEIRTHGSYKQCVGNIEPKPWEEGVELRCCPFYDYRLSWPLSWSSDEKDPLNITSVEIIMDKQSGWIDDIIIGGKIDLTFSLDIVFPAPRVWFASTTYNAGGESEKSPALQYDNTGSGQSTMVPKKPTNFIFLK